MRNVIVCMYFFFSVRAVSTTLAMKIFRKTSFYEDRCVL